MIGSSTKPMTTMMMGTLVDEGLLDWDMPVTDILPSFALSNPATAAQIRVRDMVNMSSGVPAYDARSDRIAGGNTAGCCAG
jgi:CubicO group peptidase (beta-lactamase class C family)